ncbi:hypothetical protein [Proteus phage 3H10_20]|uniref:Uncharacterized protein n=1 Tax=Proteus phage 3H10_20 TaxID=2772448 RepID=A0A7L7SMZ3_9CAUD|nr:hypothetical protein PQC37_gp054 [Proteus phage 3H10_20]QOC54840.1 hypothetical protein [Proteus phage 3H10_20]
MKRNITNEEQLRRRRRDALSEYHSRFSGQINKLLSTGLIDDEPFTRYHPNSTSTNDNNSSYDSGSSDSGGSCD